MNITQAVVLITAAGKPIGSALAQHFARQGASVVITDTNQHALEQTHRLCSVDSEKIYPHVMPGHSLEANIALFDFIEQSNHQAPTIVLNLCTGFPSTDRLEATSSDEFVHQLARATGRLLNLGKEAAKRMKTLKQKGVIINIISDGHMVELVSSDSACSIVRGFTKSWADELLPFNIRVGGILPAPSIHFCDNVAASQDELIRHTEYIVANDHFNGRVMAAQV